MNKHLWDILHVNCINAIAFFVSTFQEIEMILRCLVLVASLAYTIVRLVRFCRGNAKEN